mgnify:CR=1 FL=1
MKQIILSLLVLLTLTSTQFYTPVQNNVKTTPIQLSEIVIYGSLSVKMQPIIFPEVIITGKNSTVRTVKFYPIQIPEVIVRG